MFQQVHEDQRALFQMVPTDAQKPVTGRLGPE